MSRHRGVDLCGKAVPFRRAGSPLGIAVPDRRSGMVNAASRQTPLGRAERGLLREGAASRTDVQGKRLPDCGVRRASATAASTRLPCN